MRNRTRQIVLGTLTVGLLGGLSVWLPAGAPPPSAAPATAHARDPLIPPAGSALPRALQASGLQVQGQVLYDGMPVVGAWVRVAPRAGEGGALAGAAARTAETDEDGRFSLAAVPAGRHAVTARSGPFSSPMLDVLVGSEAPVDLSLHLRESPTVAVRVVGDDGAPVAAARVELHPVADPTAPLVFEFTGGDGRARFPFQPRGPYRLVVRTDVTPTAPGAPFVERASAPAHQSLRTVEDGATELEVHLGGSVPAPGPL